MVDQLLENDPKAIAETKATILESAWGGFEPATLERLVKSHAAKRRSPEAAEGLASFAEKRSARCGAGVTIPPVAQPAQVSFSDASQACA